MEIIGPGPTTKWAIARGEPVRDADGQIIGLRGTVQDVTARKLAAEALHESEEKLRLILESTAEAIYGMISKAAAPFATQPAFALWDMNGRTNSSAAICMD